MENLDIKHAIMAIIGGALGIGLAALMGLLHAKGIDVPCPAQPSAVIQAK